MNLTKQHREQFARDGFTVFDGVFEDREMRLAATAVDAMHRDNPAFIGNIREPKLLFLLHDERLERIAQHVLQAPQVVHVNNASLYKPPTDGDKKWAIKFEHVDIVHSVEEMDAVPKQMMSMLMVFIDDVPKGRANTFVRPGSHRLVAEHLAATRAAPVRHSIAFKNLPDLGWAEPIPVIGKRGQVVAFNTCVVHSGSNNVTSEPRRMMFSNFCALGQLQSVAGNRHKRNARIAYRNDLKTLFPPDRQHLLLDHEPPGDVPKPDLHASFRI